MVSYAEATTTGAQQARERQREAGEEGRQKADREQQRNTYRSHRQAQVEAFTDHG